MPAFKPLALGAFLFSAADGARVAKKRAATIAGVPVHNYHQAFNNDRWDASFVQAMSQMKQDNEEHWIVMLRAGLSDKEIDGVCATHKQCETRGHSGGVPFIEVRATLKELEYILASERNQVDFVEPNLPMSATPEMPANQNAVPWGLRRTRARGLASMPKSDPGARNGGKGVNAYVMDTGIRTTHVDFGGRAFPAVQTEFFGFRLKECSATDTNCALDKQGHGTHCAGTIGGTTYGMAKGVTLHAVKVLGDNGSGSTGGITKAMDWVATNAQKPAVASMSLGGGFSAALNDAVSAIVSSGITVVTASGNENTDGCSKSPGSAPAAINVGSTDITDDRSSFSNYGSCLNIFAPGRDILSSVVDSDTASKAYSGTSMACPHVSGAAALLLMDNNDMTPAQVLAELVAQATPDAVKDAKTNSPNVLLFSEV